MAEIPAPLLSRRTATAVVLFSLLGVVVAGVTVLVPIDASAPLALLVVRQLVLAAQAFTLALAVFLVWRTLARRSRLVVAGALAAMAGLVLLAVAELAWPFVVGLPDAVALVRVVQVGLAVAGALVILGMLVLGVAVLRRGHWHGSTRVTLLVAALVGALVVAAAVAAPPLLPVAYAVWSLAFLGLAVGLRSRREVANAGVPQGAAPA